MIRTDDYAPTGLYCSDFKHYRECVVLFTFIIRSTDLVIRISLQHHTFTGSVEKEAHSFAAGQKDNLSRMSILGLRNSLRFSELISSVLIWFMDIKTSLSGPSPATSDPLCNPLVPSAH